MDSDLDRSLPLSVEDTENFDPAEFEAWLDSVYSTPSTVIKTEFVYPPIPVRDFDWAAFPEGCEEAGPYGWGPTQEVAIANLKFELAEAF